MRRSLRDFGLRFPRKTKRAMLLVLIERRVVRAGAENFRQFASRRSAHEIHLPQTIAGRDVALREIQVQVVSGFDVGNAALIAPDGDAAVQTRELGRLCDGCVLAGLWGRQGE